MRPSETIPLVCVGRSANGTSWLGTVLPIEAVGDRSSEQCCGKCLPGKGVVPMYHNGAQERFPRGLFSGDPVDGTTLPSVAFGEGGTACTLVRPFAM